jgi:hypothetical protein
MPRLVPPVAAGEEAENPRKDLDTDAPADTIPLTAEDFILLDSGEPDMPLT